MMLMDESRKTGIALKDGKATHIKRTGGGDIISAPFTYFLLTPTTPSETTSAQRM